MNIRKTGASLAVAFSVLAFSAMAQADHTCAAQIAALEDIAAELACEGDTGLWYNGIALGQPIWQYQAGKGKNKDVDTDGCIVHEKLANKLEAPHDPLSPPTGKRKGNVDGTKGAINDLMDHKYQAAYDKLAAFVQMVEDAVENPGMELYAASFSSDVAAVQGQIDPLAGTCTP